MASYDDNKRFRDSVLGDVLDQAIDWIRTNLPPDEVFDNDCLIEHVQSNNDIDDVYPDAAIIEYVAETCVPGDVFSEDDLATWAEEHGWMRKPH